MDSSDSGPSHSSSDTTEPLSTKIKKRKRKANVAFASLVASIFIRNADDIDNPLIRKRYGYLGSTYGLVTNTLLFIAKLACSFIFAMETLRADAVNNASDIGMCLIALVSVFIASRPASKKHPYGSARFEYIASLIIALLIILIAGSQIFDTVGEIVDMGGLSKEVASYETATFYVPFAVMCFSVLIKLSQFFLLTGLAEKTSSMTLLATGKDARNDSIVSGMIGLSLLLSNPIGVDIDPVTAICVSSLVCLSGLAIIKSSVTAILGTTPDRELIEEFSSKIREYPIVLGIHDLEMHTYGTRSIHAYVHVEVDSSIPIMTIRDEVDRIERELERNTGIRTVIHIDPVRVGDPETDRYRNYVLEAALEIDPDISVNDFRLIESPDDERKKVLVFDLVLPYDLIDQDAEVVERVKETVKSFTNDNLTFSIDVDDRTSDLLLSSEDDDRAEEN